MLQQLQLLGRSKFVVEGNEDAATVENCVSGNQPLGLIGHENGGAVARIEVCVLKRTRQGQADFLEVGICEASFFPVAIRFDKAGFRREPVQCVTQGGTETAIFLEI